MSKANAVERRIALESGWNLKEMPLYAFDERHPNNGGEEDRREIERIRREIEVRRRSRGGGRK